MNQAHLTWFSNYLKEIYQTPVLEDFLGLQVGEVLEGKVTLSSKIAGKHCNIYGSVHGGALSSISDVAMGFACVTLGRRIVTLDQNISFIKSVPAGSTLTTVAEVISNGNTIMRTAAEIFDEQQQLIARSHASFFVIGDFNEKDYPQPMILENK